MQTLRQVVSIPNAGSNSPPFADARTIGAAAAITIVAPAALTGVCTLEIDPVGDAAAYRTAQQGTPMTDIAIAAGKAVTLPPIAAMGFRIHSAAAEGAQRDFTILIQSYR